MAQSGHTGSVSKIVLSGWLEDEKQYIQRAGGITWRAWKPAIGTYTNLVLMKNEADFNRSFAVLTIQPSL